MGNYKKYRTSAGLEKKINAYFNSISRTIIKTEIVPKKNAEGIIEKDSKNHVVYEESPIKNDLGEPIKVREYIVPPNLGDLCLYLGISRQTWSSYMKLDEFLDTTTRARARVEAYLHRELDTRLKGTDGIKFDLEENFGWREKIDVYNHETVEDYLSRLDGKEQSEF